MDGYPIGSSEWRAQGPKSVQRPLSAPAGRWLYPGMTTITRRRLLGAVGAAGVWAASGAWRHPSLGEVERALPGNPWVPVDPARSGIEHVVVVMMENRSFDHFLGWLPGANGAQDTSRRRYPDRQGRLHANYHLADPMGCAHPDPDHSYAGGRFQLHGGAMDNFARGRNDTFAIGFYGEADRPFMSALARHYTTCDAYFCSFMGPTWPNRLFLHAGQTERLGNRNARATVPTIWDQLNQPGGPTGRYYYSDVPFIGLWGGKYRRISAPYQQFLADAQAGTLPNVAYLDPEFIGAGKGRGNDDHPRAHIGAGDAFLGDVFHALSHGPGWQHTVLIVTYDEWGGFYDHVAPPRVTPGIPLGAQPGSDVDRDMVNGRVLLGFRVPCIVASPFSRSWDPRRPVVDHRLYDHTSVLKLIEWRWRLRPLSQRDASTQPTDPGNLADALRLASPDASVPPGIPRPKPPVLASCGSPHAQAALAAEADDDTWTPILEVARQHGWNL
jgi:phospholipase C